MIDIHSHILPMVDDGSRTIEMSLKMLDEAYRDGTDELVLTPHLAYPYGFINPAEKIRSLFEDFKEIVKEAGIPVKLYPGCEYLYRDRDSFEEELEEITTLNDTRYLLMEFYFNVEDQIIYEAVKVVMKHQLIPVIAHPERYEAIQISDHLAKDIIDMGGMLQMNKGSISGKYGRMARDTIYELLDHDLITFIGSDGHDPSRRNARMYQDYRIISELYGNKRANRIFKENPRRMLQNIDLTKKEIMI